MKIFSILVRQYYGQVTDNLLVSFYGLEQIKIGGLDRTVRRQKKTASIISDINILRRTMLDHVSSIV